MKIIMENFAWSSKKRNNDKWWILVALSLLTIFFIWKSIIDSGHLFFYIACIILWIVVYFSFQYIQKKIITKPASLWETFKKKYPIIVQYAPPKWINPAEAWLLYNLSVEPTDLTSLIYQWKFEKLIDIKTFKWKNSGKEFIKLIKLKDMPLTRPLFESEIFDSIFCMWDFKIIEWAFQLRYALMLEDLEYHWIQKWWVIYKRPKNIRIMRVKGFDSKFWVESYLFLMYFFAAIFSFLTESLGVSDNISVNIPVSFGGFVWFLAIIILICIWLVLLFWKIDGRWNLKFTDKWAELASKVIGYSQFIKSCDENKIKLLLKEDPLFIDRTLPYATAFWMETEFLNKISPLKKDWNARYVRWQKVPSWIWILRFFLKDDDNSLL